MSENIQKLSIYEADEGIRAMICASLLAHDLDEYCKVLDVEAFKGAESGMLYLCDPAQKKALMADSLLPEYDILVKPVRLGGLLDRIVAYVSFQQGTKGERRISIGSYELDPAHNLLSKNGTADITRLTEKETAILCLLHAANGGIVTRAQMLEQVWGYVQGVETHTLETHIYRLRQKIEGDASAPILLLTQENGYSLALG